MRQFRGKRERYRYKNLPIPGGGYVTGFLFHKRVPDVFYIRTDIGGVYRFDREEERWVSLIDHVTMDDLSETFPIAVALDDDHPERLYIACGVNKAGAGKIAVSDDYGSHFVYHNFPILIHGNLNGRGTADRLIVDKKNGNKLYYASQQEGLWISEDRGAHWRKCASCPEEYLTFAGMSEDGSALLIGSAGVTSKRSEHLRGHSLYVSYDGGARFEKLWQPEDGDGEIEGVKLAGLIAQRYAMDEKYLYVTYSVMGRNAYVLENGYSCDGGSVIGGRVVRYPIEGIRFGQGEDITPGLKGSILEHGFGGIDAAASKPGLVVCSTICKEDGDSVYRSFDYGQTWEEVLYNLEKGELSFRASYMKPQYNGGGSIIHWLSDFKINPFNEKEGWFNTGTGVFRTQNLTADKVVFSDWCDGLEETVHLNLYSPPAGEVQLIDILGDLGGFAFRDLDTPCDNSFDDADGNRYITCINADYSDRNPNCVVVTPRGNWKGKTKGGLILSKDQCKTFDRLPMPFGLTSKLDRALRAIEQPNVNSGWVAISPDENNIVWSVAEGINLPADMVIVSGDGGRTFRTVQIFDTEGNPVEKDGVKVFSDRMDSSLFYGFGEHSEFYVSRDGGVTYRQRELPGDFPDVNFALIDCANKTEVRGECGKQGVFYMALGENGLWKLHYDKEKDDINVIKLSKSDDIFYRIGLGILRPGGDYAGEDKAIYTAAKIDGEYGFYRSVDDAKTFVRLNSENQMYGEINSLEADSRVYGRFYLGTGSRGVLYGEPET
ncbi:MAG: endoglucanase [Lachnospiraceae bacterium]|nr:endoglucanase [Lachnospiraceae bacterium]